MNGTFVLCIEDTDRERHGEETTNAMRSRGMDWDEGPEVGDKVSAIVLTTNICEFYAEMAQFTSKKLRFTSAYRRNHE
jgi:glutamyl/glutaminyl-tRNA synthetase